MNEAASVGGLAVLLLQMKCRLLSFQIGYNLLGLVYGDLIANRALYAAVSLNRILNLGALVTHSLPPFVGRKPVGHPSCCDGGRAVWFQ
jgi:hypothetical protein